MKKKRAGWACTTRHADGSKILLPLRETQKRYGHSTLNTHSARRTRTQLALLRSSHTKLETLRDASSGCGCRSFFLGSNYPGPWRYHFSTVFTISSVKAAESRASRELQLQSKRCHKMKSSAPGSQHWCGFHETSSHYVGEGSRRRGYLNGPHGAARRERCVKWAHVVADVPRQHPSHELFR